MLNYINILIILHVSIRLFNYETEVLESLIRLTKNKLVKAKKRGINYVCDSRNISRKELGKNGEVRDTFIVFLNVGEVKMDGLAKKQFY